MRLNSAFLDSRQNCAIDVETIVVSELNTLPLLYLINIGILYTIQLIFGNSNLCEYFTVTFRWSRINEIAFYPSWFLQS